jgi:metal-responsive CopG/Arc/MetJ family transcriptional regulator
MSFKNRLIVVLPENLMFELDEYLDLHPFETKSKIIRVLLKSFLRSQPAPVPVAALADQSKPTEASQEQQ